MNRLYFTLLAGLLALALQSSPVNAQNTPMAPGSVWGNNQTTQLPPRSATLTSMFDQAFCNTVGYVVARTVGAWVCSNSIPVPVTWFGAKGTGVRSYDCAITSGTKTLVCPANGTVGGPPAFTSSVVGETIQYGDIGNKGANGVNDITDTIATFVNATTVTLTNNAVMTFAAGATDTSITNHSIPDPTTLPISQTYTTANTGKPFYPDATVLLQTPSTGSPTAQMYGRVVSYSGTSLVISIISTSGAGSGITDWKISTYAAEAIYGPDDTTAIQTATNQACSSGSKLAFPQGLYLISAQINCAIEDQSLNNMLTNLFSDQYDYPVNLRTIEIEGYGRPNIVAVQPMSSMLNITFGASINPMLYSTPTPWKSVISNITFNGSFKAAECVHTDSMREDRIYNASLIRCTTAYHGAGVYGGTTIRDSDLFGCQNCIEMDTGDSFIDNVGFAPYTPQGGVTVYGAYYPGLLTNAGGGHNTIQNSTFESVFSPAAPFVANLYAGLVQGTIAANTLPRDFTFTNNEIQGYTAGFVIQGFGSGGTPVTVYHVNILGNHTVINANGVYNPGELASLSYVSSFIVSGNQIGDPFNITSGVSVEIDNSKNGSIVNNNFQNTSSSPIIINSSDQISVLGNIFRDVGQASPSDQAVLVNSSLRTAVSGNNLYQSGSFAGTFLQEAGAANYTNALNNSAPGVSNLYLCSGANSTCGLQVAGTASSVTSACVGDACAISLNNQIAAAGPTGSATVSPIITYNAKGQLTTVSSATISPAISSVTGLGTGVASALSLNVGASGGLVVIGGALGTPTSGNGSNITNVNAAALGGATFAAPGPIGSGTPGSGAFTTLSSSSTTNTSGPSSGAITTLGGVGVAKDIQVGGAIAVTGQAFLNGNAQVTGTLNVTSTYVANGVSGVSCSVGTLNPVTAIVSNGIITHC